MDRKIFFISLASGSSGNCYFLGSREFGFLIDVGIPFRTIKKKLEKENIPIESIQAIFITHNHWDHIKAVETFAIKSHIPVYALLSVKECICSHKCFSDELKPSDIRELTLNHKIEVGDYSITPFYVPHDSVANCGFVIEFLGKRFTLATDVGSPTDELRELISKTDYLVIEANHDEVMLNVGPYPPELKERVRSDKGHLSNRVVAELLNECVTERLTRIFLCHLSDKNNTPDLAYKTVVQTMKLPISVTILDRKDTIKFTLCGA